jgi:predicted sulfurtransferase
MYRKNLCDKYTNQLKTIFYLNNLYFNHKKITENKFKTMRMKTKPN